MKIKEDDTLLCTVKKIEGTSVFVETESGTPGTMVLSEVAAGRIRNLREYVFPNKKIVCKVLKIHSDRLELSLRRVTAKERDQVIEEHKKERALASMLKIIGENAEKVIEKIKEELSVTEFIDEAKEDPKIIEKYLQKENALKLAKILSEKEEREKKVDGKFMLKTFSGNGINQIKEILDIKNCEIHYLGSSNYSIAVSGKEFKESNAKLAEILEEIKKRAKEKGASIEVKEK
jgi:translation initiation factor 2 alpha subunit (eIF-2alpha)